MLRRDVHPLAALSKASDGNSDQFGIASIVPIVEDDSPYLSAQPGRIAEQLTAAGKDSRAICAAYRHAHFEAIPAVRETSAADKQVTPDAIWGAKAVTTTELIALQVGTVAATRKAENDGPWFKRTREHNPHAVLLPSQPVHEKLHPRLQSA